MSVTRIMIAVCLGMLLGTGGGNLIVNAGIFQGMIESLVLFAIIYVPSALVAAFGNKKHPILSTVITGSILCILNFSYVTFFVFPELIFSPSIFITALLLSLGTSTFIGWLVSKYSKGHQRVKAEEMTL